MAIAVPTARNTRTQPVRGSRSPTRTVVTTTRRGIPANVNNPPRTSVRSTTALTPPRGVPRPSPTSAVSAVVSAINVVNAVAQQLSQPADPLGWQQSTNGNILVDECFQIFWNTLGNAPNWVTRTYYANQFNIGFTRAVPGPVPNNPTAIRDLYQDASIVTPGVYQIPLVARLAANPDGSITDLLNPDGIGQPLITNPLAPTPTPWPLELPQNAPFANPEPSPQPQPAARPRPVRQPAQSPRANTRPIRNIAIYPNGTVKVNVRGRPEPGYKDTKITGKGAASLIQIAGRILDIATEFEEWFEIFYEHIMRSFNGEFDVVDFLYDVIYNLIEDKIFGALSKAQQDRFKKLFNDYGVYPSGLGIAV